MQVEQYYHQHRKSLLPAVADRWASINKHYRGRAYHNLHHLREMLDHLVGNPSAETATSVPRPDPPRQPHLFALSLIYHDLIYHAGRTDNEVRSAAALTDVLAANGHPINDQAYCTRLIVATKHHVPSTPEAYDEALLIDLDLAVLARPRAGYLKYARAVRREFNLFPDFLYRQGRRKALRHLLANDRLYHTDFFHERLEARARENLATELEEL